VKLSLGTRGSALALTQSGTVADALREAGYDVELSVIRTEGDRSQALSFGSIGAQGVFVREIEQALLRGDVDLAVHSFKDLPTASPDGLTIAAIPRRVDAADVLIRREGALSPRRGESGSGDDGELPLPAGARVGTSSVRRGAWLRHFRPDLTVEPLRGNVPTRILKLRDGGYDAILLAAAGVERLKAGGDALDAPLVGLTASRLDPRRFVPAPAQGALAVQCRGDRDAVVAALAALDDGPTRTAVTLERDALRRAEGGCNTAFGAYCTASGDAFELTAMLERDGKAIRVSVAGDAAGLVERLWDRLRATAGHDSASDRGASNRPSDPPT
jgi:hydroxymethylbilane synthase